jgi:hypothetical protein
MASNRAMGMSFVRRGGPPNSAIRDCLLCCSGRERAVSLTVHLLHYSEAGEPAFIARPADAPVYYGFPLLPDSEKDGFIFGVITRSRTDAPLSTDSHNLTRQRAPPCGRKVRQCNGKQLPGHDQRHYHPVHDMDSMLNDDIAGHRDEHQSNYPDVFPAEVDPKIQRPSAHKSPGT